jgi:phage shock protein C
MAQTRKLYRSRSDRKLAGVCGGLAQYFNLDATLIRVPFVVLALLGGPAS